MAQVELYFYVEDLGLTVAQRNTIISQLQGIGQRDNDPNPKNRNHWRIRPDNKAVIFEAWWEDSHLTPTAIRNRLASIFGVSPTSITYTTTNTAYGGYADFSYNSTPRLRMGIFGGANSNYGDSQEACRAFLLASPAWSV